MTTTDNLGITEVAPSQTAKEQTVNEALNQLDNATQDTFAFTFTTNARTLSGSEFTNHFEFVAGSLTGNGTLTVPLTKRFFAVDNTGSGHQLTVGGASGATVVMASGARALIKCTGTNCYLYAGSGSGSGITSVIAQGGPFLANGTITASGTISNSASSLTAHGILLAEGTSAATATAAMTNGQLLIGSTGADPAPRTMSGDGTINSGGTLVISTVGGNKPVVEEIVTAPWLGISPNNAVIYEFRNAGTVTEVIGNAEILNGASFTVQLAKSGSGTAVASGVTVTSTTFNANTLAFTDQTLTITGTNAVGAVGDRIGLIATGTAASTMVASITIKVKPT